MEVELVAKYKTVMVVLRHRSTILGMHLSHPQLVSGYSFVFLPRKRFMCLPVELIALPMYTWVAM